jgi:hypothetical protein
MGAVCVRVVGERTKTSEAEEALAGSQHQMGEEAILDEDQGGHQTGCESGARHQSPPSVSCRYLTLEQAAE